MDYNEQAQANKKRREAFAAWMDQQGFTPDQVAEVESFVEFERDNAYEDGAANERESRL